MQTIETDLSCTSLKELSTIARDPKLQHYVHRLTITGTDTENTILGEGFQYERHPSGQLINLQEHPAVKQIEEILRQLFNCKSFKISTMARSPHPVPRDELTHEEAITVFLDIITRAGLHVRSFNIQYWGNHEVDADRLLSENNADPRQRITKAQYTALVTHLEELKLRYIHEPCFEIGHKWPFDMIFCAPKLRKLWLGSTSVPDYAAFIHCFAFTERPWPQLQELELFSVPGLVEDFTALLQRVKNTLRVLKFSFFRLKSTHQDLKQKFRTWDTDLLALDRIEIVSLQSSLSAWDLVHFSKVVENLQGLAFRIESKVYQMTNKIDPLTYSGPKMNVALDIIADKMDFILREDRIAEVLSGS